MIAIPLLALAAAPQEFTRTTLQVSKDARVLAIESTAAVDPRARRTPPAPLPLTLGVGWSFDDAGLGWIGSAVALGNAGTHVFSETSKNAHTALLLSTFDVAPPTPYWSAPVVAAEARRVVSAQLGDLHVASRELVTGPQRVVELVARRSVSAQALWSYVFEAPIDTGSRVGVSRDGSTVVAAISRDAIGRVDVAVIDGATGVERSYTSIAVPGSLRGFDLSADGEWLCFTAAQELYVFEVDEAKALFQGAAGTPLDALAVSGDGRVLAFGGYNWMRVWERDGSIWEPTYTRFVPGANYVSALDVSDDGSTVAFGATYYDTFATVRVEALDVPTKTVVMSDTVTTAPGLQTIVSDVALSANGARFAVGTWGDALGAIGEIRYYARDENAPLANIDLAGSVFDVDISLDGQRVAAASKAVHANVLGLGGAITLFDADENDFTLRGAPRLGSTPLFVVRGAPGDFAWLLMSEALAPTPFPMGGGMLYLDRDRIEAFPVGPINSAGISAVPYTLSTAPGLIGATLYFQGLTSAPARLTRDWLALMILP